MRARKRVRELLQTPHRLVLSHTHAHKLKVILSLSLARARAHTHTRAVMGRRISRRTRPAQKCQGTG
jgi:hypothetical protein